MSSPCLGPSPFRFHRAEPGRSSPGQTTGASGYSSLPLADHQGSRLGSKHQPYSMLHKLKCMLPDLNCLSALVNNDHQFVQAQIAHVCAIRDSTVYLLNTWRKQMNFDSTSRIIRNNEISGAKHTLCTCMCRIIRSTCGRYCRHLKLSHHRFWFVATMYTYSSVGTTCWG